MNFKFAAFGPFLALALVCTGTSARPNDPAASVLSAPASTNPAPASTLSAGSVRQIQATLREALPLYRTATTTDTATAHSHKEHGHDGKLSIVHLILIIGKVLAPLVGAIIEPLLINIAKGITWAITYSLATGFEKPPSYEHFVPALEHHFDGDDDGEYESHTPSGYSLKELPGLALQLTSVLTESSQRPEKAEAIENAERKLVGLLLQGKPVQ